MPRPKPLKNQFTLEECRLQIVISNEKGYVNIRLPDGRYLVIESMVNLINPEICETNVNKATEKEDSNERI